MYDGLDSTLSSYGSVAEYFRSNNEERPDPFREEYNDFPSVEKMEMDKRRAHLDDLQIELLNGKPSAMALSLAEKYKAALPKEKDFETYFDYNDACLTAKRNNLFDCVKQLDFEYGVHIALDGPRYMEHPNTFGISVKYYDDNDEKNYHMAVADLDLATFEALFRDLYHLDFSPVMHYVDNNLEKHDISGFSLGYLRKHEFPALGIESENAVEKELAKVGLDEKSNADYLSLKSDTMACDAVSCKVSSKADKKSVRKKKLQKRNQGFSR